MFRKNKVTAPFIKTAKTPMAEMTSEAVPPEVVAAIAGVVAVICGSAAIRSIRRSTASRSGSRGAWGNASVFENTRAF